MPPLQAIPCWRRRGIAWRQPCWPGGVNGCTAIGPGLLRDLLAAGAPEAGLQVLQEQDVQAQLQIGSSSEVLPGDRHWSRRQQTESLYLSGGRPSASQRSNEAS